MKKVLLSLLSIGVVAVVAVYATQAFFSDIETSKNNVLKAGIVDIMVDGQNPWTKTYSETLQDMKPSETRYIEFTVRNLVDSNPVKVWKHLDIVSQEDGVITEPECEEGKGTWVGGATPCTGYTPRNNLAAYTIYDLWIDILGDGKSGWDIISGDQYVRLDNISSTWIYLGQLEPSQEMKVRQSYHLSSWPDAPEPEVTNWAQGDIMTFDMEIYAEQLGGPGPKGAQAMMTLENKNPTTWEPISDAISGQLTFNTSGSTFIYNFTGIVPQVSTDYCLIYYADPWPGDGKTHITGMDIECKASDVSGNLTLGGNINLNTDLPNPDDQNYPGGAKLQVVLDTDYDNTNDKMTGWNPTKYLFEMNLITYDDTDVP